MRQVAALIADVLRDTSSEQNIVSVRRGVEDLTARFPLYAWKRQNVAEASPIPGSGFSLM